MLQSYGLCLSYARVAPLKSPVFCLACSVGSVAIRNRCPADTLAGGTPIRAHLALALRAPRSMYTVTRDRCPADTPPPLVVLSDVTTSALCASRRRRPRPLGRASRSPLCTASSARSMGAGVAGSAPSASALCAAGPLPPLGAARQGMRAASIAHAVVGCRRAWWLSPPAWRYGSTALSASAPPTAGHGVGEGA